MTRPKATFHVSPVSAMAAVFSALLFLGLFYSYARANSAVSDIKLNGMDGKVTITSGSTLFATVQLDAGDQIGEMAEWWIVAETSMGWYYYEYPDGWNFSEDGMEGLMTAYQGALFNMTEPLEVIAHDGVSGWRLWLLFRCGHDCRRFDGFGNHVL